MDVWALTAASYLLMSATGYFVHPTAIVDPGARIGPGTKIWHFCHVTAGAVIGKDCVVGQGCYVDDVHIGDGVRIQNNVSVYKGVILDDGVFCGPSAVFTNVKHPRSHVNRKDEFAPTRVGKGATIGANATVVCGATIGAHAFVAAGAVVAGQVREHALVMGVPARQRGWVCVCGERLAGPGPGYRCSRCDASFSFGA